MKNVAHERLARLLIVLIPLTLAAGCGGSTAGAPAREGTGASGDSDSPNGNVNPGPGYPGGKGGSSGGAAGGSGGSSSLPGVGSSADAGAGPSAGGAGGNPGSFGNVGVSGAQDFGAFRRALESGQIPGKDTIDAAGFFAEHFTALPPPTCGRAFCLHGMLSVSQDLARGGPLTLLQMAMNSTIDPSTIKKPPLNLAVVLDHSGSMAAAGKMDFARQGVQLLVDALGPTDTFTLIAFDDSVQTVFGPAHVVDKAALKGRIAEIQPAGGTNIYAGLEAGYHAVLGTPNENEQRRVIFLTDGLPTAGVIDPAQIQTMSVGYNKQYVGVTTIGLGGDVNIPLLRGLAEQGGGNFYFVEKPEAVREVFMEELAFFVAPIAFDLELTFNQLPNYSVKNVHGTSLWQPFAGGGKVTVPSVFLVSRTSTAPGPNGGGRRGGGSAIMAELSRALTAPALSGTEPIGKLSLKYRLPGMRDFETQETDITYNAPNGPAPEVPDFYSDKAVEKNTIIMNFFFAFRDAATYAQTDQRRALDLLTAFQIRMQPRLATWTDEDLADDLKLLQRFIDVLKTAAPGRL
jgi:Ca-activated chloride channel family protein